MSDTPDTVIARCHSCGQKMRGTDWESKLERELARQNNAVAALNEDCKEAERQLAAAKAKLSDAEAELERRQAKIMSAKAECEALRRDAARRLRLLQLHHADAMELWKALNDLSFECDNVFATRDGKAGAPSMETYNRTFTVMDKHRAGYSEHARKAALQGNTAMLPAEQSAQADAGKKRDGGEG